MLQSTGLGCGLLFLLFWTAGCRGERVAFRFQPVMTQATVSAPDTLVPGESAEAACAAGRLSLAAPAVPRFQARHHKRQHKPLGGSRANTSAPFEQVVPQHTIRRASPHGMASKPRRSIDDPPWGGIMFLFGVALCIAGVVVGINIGGWSGLGIGTLMYLVGAYIGARGFAGPNKSASASMYSGPTRRRRKFIIRNKSWKPTQKAVSTTSLGEIIFIIGSLAMITGVFAGIIVGLLSILPGISLGALALWLFFGGLVAIIAYAGIR
jgi:hypothetical protein